MEQLKNGAKQDLRIVPAIIGGNQESRRGVVLAKSGPAKKYGICTGEPVANALRKCPNLIVESPNHVMYGQYSKQLMSFLHQFTPDIEEVSVDECYLDFTGIAHQYASPIVGAMTIKNAVYDTFGFSVNIGISTNKLLAKMASDFEKPNKVHTLFIEEIPVKMWPLPVSELYMAGASSVETLQKLEIQTIGELAKADKEILELHLKSQGVRLWEFANGIAPSQVISEKMEAKGIGNSTTLPEDVVEEEEAKNVLFSLVESVGARLRKASQKAQMLSVEIKYHTFEVNSHQKQLYKASNSDKELYEAAVELFEELWNQEPIRLLGVRSSKLVKEDEPEQLSIFDFAYDKDKKESMLTIDKKQKLEEALLKIKGKYGEDIVKRGRFLK